MAKTLQMHFNTPQGKTWTLTVRHPKEGVTGQEVKTTMNGVISSGIFLKQPTSIKGASLVDRTVTVINLED